MKSFLRWREKGGEHLMQPLDRKLAVIGRIGFMVSFVFALAPLVITLIAGLIANGLSCRLDEAAAYPCLVAGIDIGGLLSFLGMTGWLALITLPVGMLAALGFGTVALIGYGRHALRRAAEETTAKGKVRALLFPGLGVAALLGLILLFLALL